MLVLYRTRLQGCVKSGAVHYKVVRRKATEGLEVLVSALKSLVID